MQKAYVKTYGCQMNEQDSAQMQSLLKMSGYTLADDEFDADLILINTCSIREKAVHKIYSDLGRVRPLKEMSPDLIVGLAGCVSEMEKESIAKRFPFLDLVFGPDHIRQLPQMLQKVAEQRAGKQKAVVQTGFDLRKDFKFVNVLPDQNETKVKAFVTIQKGCDNVCSFCIVPFVRGREVSRPATEIINEIKQLVDHGVKEVTLLGQNVNSYGFKSDDGVSFAKLLEMIAQQTQIKRVRFTSSHPKDVKDDLIEQFAHNPIVCPQFHLPVQSGSNRILQEMRRFYTREDYLGTVEKLKKYVPDIRFSTDIIVGYPSETRADFEQTLDIMRQVQFDLCFSFVYSPRPFTKASKIEEQDTLSKEEKQERLKELQDLERHLAACQNDSLLGTTQDVLIEDRHEDSDADYRYMGRTLSNKIIHFNKADFLDDDFARVKVVKTSVRSLMGE